MRVGSVLGPRSLVAAIDQGTTSSRCLLFDGAARVVAAHQLEHAQITPKTAVRPACGERSVRPAWIVEPLRPSDRRDGRSNAIVGKTATPGRRGPGRDRDRFRDLTGLPISTYSSALKLAWILEAGGRPVGPRPPPATSCSARSTRG